MSKKTLVKSQPTVQIEAQRLEYLLRKRIKEGDIERRFRFDIFSNWLESDSSSIDLVSASTSLKDISITARRLLLSFPSDEPTDGRGLLLQWSKIPHIRHTSDRLKSKKEANLLLTESLREIEAWLFSVAIYILWKRESKCTDALALCCRAISFTSTHLNNIATLSPRSHIEREENEDKKSSLKLLISNLQNYETLIAQECVQSYVAHEGDGSSKLSVHNQRFQSLQRRMDFNKQRLESLNTRMDFKANMMNFNLIDVTCGDDEKSKFCDMHIYLTSIFLLIIHVPF